MLTRTGLTKIAVSLALAAMGLVFMPPASAGQTVAAAPRSKPKAASKTPARATSTTAKKKAYSASTARARRAQLARARATARARELRELQTPRFTVDEFGREVPDVRAEAAIIFNPDTGEILWENHAKDQRSIASITKVMTALVFLESGADLDQMVTVQRSDVARRCEPRQQGCAEGGRQDVEPAEERMLQRRVLKRRQRRAAYRRRNDRVQGIGSRPNLITEDQEAVHDRQHHQSDGECPRRRKRRDDRCEGQAGCGDQGDARDVGNQAVGAPGDHPGERCQQRRKPGHPPTPHHTNRHRREGCAERREVRDRLGRPISSPCGGKSDEKHHDRYRNAHHA